MLNKLKGDIGEDAAAKFLVKKGFKIVERNFKSKLGEIDIVALDGDTLVFVEVKNRTTAKFGLPREAVDFNKQQKLIKNALYYIQTTNAYKVKKRFDVVEILDEKITHIPNAFEVNY